MARIPRVAQARAAIELRLSSLGLQVFTPELLNRIIQENRQTWNLPVTPAPEKIAGQLVDLGIFKMHDFLLSNGMLAPRFIFGNASIFEIAVSLKPKSYISHYPAVYLNQLTTQVPKTIYTTWEQSVKQKPNKIQSQEAIDRVFSSPQRRSALLTEYEGYAIVLLNGRHTNRQGVISRDKEWRNFSVTNLERTLIDITVRPNYAGGCFAVLEAFRRAQKENLSLNKLMAYLTTEPYTYPYPQAIGFYLQRAGYSGKALEPFRKKISPYTFYLDYDIKEKVFDPEWKIYYPKGM
jgi:hypothetical protein